MISKKITVFILTLLAIGNFILAKDVQVEPEQNAVLEVWDSFGPEQDFLKYAAKEFEKKYAKFNVKVNYAEIETTKTIEKMQLAIQGGRGADVYVFGHDGLPSAINGGIIMPNLVSADRIKKDFVPTAVQAATGPNGKIYAFPLSIETYGLFYNKKYFSKAPKTFEEIMEVGKKITDRSKDIYGFYYEINGFYFTYAFLAMEGGYVFGNNGYNVNDIGLNNAGAVKGLEDLISLKPISVENSAAVTNASMIGLFGDNKIAAIITGPWSVEGLDKIKANYGIAPLPTFKGKHPISFCGLRLFGVSPASKYKKAAQLFAKFCTTDELLLKRFEITRQIPPVKSMINNPEIAKNPKVKPFLEQIEYSKTTPAVPEMRLVWDPAKAAVDDAWMGKATPKEALDNLVHVLKQQIELQNGK